MNLKKIIATATFAAMGAVSVAPAFAQGIPKLTDAEKSTVKQAQQLGACTEKFNQKVTDKVKTHIEGIMSAREEATKKALLASGLSDEAAKQASGLMSINDTRAVMQMLVPTLILNEMKPYFIQCGKPLGIADDKGLKADFEKARDSLVEKYGPHIFDAAPQQKMRPA